MELKVNISGYEGPLDLLLDLSKKQKVDIKKISILELADQYLKFIEINLDNLKLSADYLVMASLLAFLKSKLLLPVDDSDEIQEIEEDITKRLIHYSAIRELGKQIFELPQQGKNFLYVNIKNDFSISNKLVPRVSLQDLILKYAEILKKKTTLKIISDKDNLYTIEDGKRWLEFFFKSELKKKWNFLFNFLPKKLYDNQVKKSAVISLLLASLNNVKNGKIEMNQQKHFDNIMIKEKL